MDSPPPGGNSSGTSRRVDPTCDNNSVYVKMSISLWGSVFCSAAESRSMGQSLLCYSFEATLFSPGRTWGVRRDARKLEPIVPKDLCSQCSLVGVVFIQVSLDNCP